MRKVGAWKLFAVVLAFALCGSTLDAREDATERARELFIKAKELSDLRSGLSTALSLRARFRVRGGPDGIEGTYLLVGAPPNRWREEIASEGYYRLRGGTEEGYWQVRNLEFEPLGIYELTMLLSTTPNAYLGTAEKVNKLRQRNRNGRELECVEIQVEQNSGYERCFEKATGAPAWVKSQQYEWHYSEYVSIGRKVAPRRYSLLEKGHLVAELTVEEIKPETSLDSSLFIPPDNAKVWHWCSDIKPPAVAKRVTPKYPQAAKDAQIQGVVRVYLVVGADGSPRDLTIVQSAGPHLDATTLEALQQWRYEPAQCNGEPVEFETIALASYQLGVFR